MATQKVYSLDLELGSNQYASISNASQTGLNLSTKGTIEAWVNFESLPNNGIYQNIVSKDAGGTNRSYSFRLFNSSGTYRLEGLVYDGGNFDLYSYNWTPIVGVWYHVALTIDVGNPSATTFEFFINGVSVGNGTAIVNNNLSAINNSTASFVIGRQDGIASYFDGLIEEVRVWNDVRTQAEIATNMFTKLVPANEANLVGYWRFENDYLDETANNNDLTSSGSPVFVSTPDSVPFTYYLESADNLSAMKFDGSNDALSVTDHSDLKPTGNFSIGCWIKFPTAGTNVPLFQSYAESGSKIAGFGLEKSTNNKVVLYSGKNTGTTNNTDFAYVESSLTLSTNVWYFVVGTWDGSNINVYVNGKLEGTKSWANAPAYQATNYVRIGCRNLTGTNTTFGNGFFDHIFLINGTALSEAQIEGLLAKKINITDFANLKALWDFEGNLNDTSASTNTHNASLIDAPYYVPDPAFDARGNRRSLDLESGSSQYARITNDLGITNGNCTIELWFNPESTPTSGNAFRLAGKSDAGTNVTYGIRYHNNSGTPRLTFWRVREGTSTDEATYNVTLTNGSWYHIALTYDGSNVRGYLNGVLVAGPTASSGNGSEGGGDFFDIGGWENTEYTDGKVDDVRVWSDERTQTEIDDNKSKKLVGNEANLVGYWMLGNNYTDLTSNNNNLTPSGSPTFSWIVPFDGSVTSSIKKIAGVLYANIKKIGGVAIASVKKAGGLA